MCAEHASLSLSESQTIRVVGATPQALELISEWSEPGEAPPMHLHPVQTERFEILAGEVTVRLGGAEPRVYRAGETLDVPPKTPHCMWNAGPEPASASWQVTPALRTLDMFRVLDSRPSVFGKIAMLLRFRNEYRLARS